MGFLDKFREKPGPNPIDYRNWRELWMQTDPEPAQSAGLQSLYDFYMPPSLIYEPLSTVLYQFRILNLGASNAGVLFAHLEVAELTNPEEYTALSYCWGNPKDTSPLLVTYGPNRLGPAAFLATSNLKKALLHLFKLGHRRVWVDALCINQADAEERSLQVRNMQLIYSRAKYVIAYVGDAETAEEVEGVKPAKSEAEMVLGILKAKDKIEKYGGKEWKAVLHFFQQPYWARVWIIQECAVAQYINILYGGVLIPWESLEQWLKAWNAASSALQQPEISYAEKVVQLRQKHVAEIPIPLMHALEWTSKSLATEPRDKIFALLGLSSDGSKLVPLPNYSQGLGILLAEFTVHVMKKERSLDLISLGSSEDAEKPAGRGPAERIKIRPTWVPDWLNFWARQRTAIEFTLMKNRSPQWDLSLGILSVASTLKVRGKEIGRVEALSTRLGDDKSMRCDFSSDHRWSAPLAKPITKEAIVGALSLGELNTPEDITCFGMLWDLEWYRSKVTSCWQSSWNTHSVLGGEWGSQWQSSKIMSDLMREWVDRNATLMISNLYTLERVASELRIDVEITEKVKKEFGAELLTNTGDEICGVIVTRPIAKHRLENFIERIEKVLGSGLRLMVTAEGDVGMVPQHTRAGDWICQIYGCSVPVVLRSAGTNMWKVVGAAYVHGLKPLSVGNIGPPSEEITLC